MRSHFFLWVILFIVVGCATPYAPKSWRGGYYDYQAGGKNRYIVGFSGNSATSADEVRKLAHRRAEELCQEKGFQGYKILDKNQEVDIYKNQTQTNCIGSSYGNNFSQNTQIECHKTPAIESKKINSELLIECEKSKPLYF